MSKKRRCAVVFEEVDKDMEATVNFLDLFVGKTLIELIRCLDCGCTRGINGFLKVDDFVQYDVALQPRPDSIIERIERDGKSIYFSDGKRMHIPVETPIEEEAEPQDLEIDHGTLDDFAQYLADAMAQSMGVPADMMRGVQSNVVIFDESEDVSDIEQCFDDLWK